MTASNRPRTPVARQRVPRRPACVPASSAQPPGPRDGNGLKVTIRVIPLSEAESNPLRAQQLGVIVNLLRRAAAEAATRDAAPDRGELNHEIRVSRPYLQ
jgi:hypothetical protein